MSTGDPSGADPAGAPPEELRLVLGLLPTAGVAPEGVAPSPGAALAGARVAGGPTLPDWDPSALTAIVSRFANELFVQTPETPPQSTVSAPRLQETS